MVYYVVMLITLMLLINGCGHREIRQSSNSRVPMEDMYHHSMREAKEDVEKFVAERFREQKVFGYVKPYVPVIKPPVVKKVWVPNHRSVNDTGVLVSGHWVYVMIQGPRWFDDQEVQRSSSSVVIPKKEEVEEEIK